MRVVHDNQRNILSKHVSEDVGFLLSNNQGAYVSFFSQKTSRYQGWFVYLNGNLCKIIDQLNIQHNPSVTELHNNFWKIDRRRNHVFESYLLPDNFNSLVYELSETTDIELVLDVRGSYDSDNLKTNYIFNKQDDLLIFKIERNSYQPIYLVIKFNEGQCQNIGQWREANYDYDKKRNSAPFKKDVYHALKIVSDKIVFSVSNDEAEAVKEARLVYHNTNALKHLKMARAKSLPLLNYIKDKELKMACLCAQNALENQTVVSNSRIGIYAGLPWFWQFWSRDEAVCIKSLATFLRKEALGILERLIVSVNSDGRVFAKPAPSADAAGWIFTRLSQLYEDGEFNQIETNRIKIYLEQTIDGLLKHHTRQNLDYNNAKETWMDSIDRSGANIEIQALRLSIYRFAHCLFRKLKYKSLEQKLKKAVLAKFFQNNILIDNLEDNKIRPNVFIAAYIYPDLLKKKQWSNCFETILPKLWLDWGGLATLDITDPQFRDRYTGQDPSSYHNGDSWFWLNNLAAQVLYRTDRLKFNVQVNKILQASTQEILWQGIAGHHTELSSANQLQSEGCWSQAWSSAMYLELVKQILGH